MKLIFLMLVLFINVDLSAQGYTIEGVVVDDENKPLNDCNVFINNTSLGTSTNADGRFILSNIPSGKYELIVTFIGYTTFVQPIYTDQLDQQLRIVLKKKIMEMENVVVGGYIKESWEKWGTLFLEYFLGVTPIAKKCIIKNTNDIQFRYYKNSNSLRVVASQPLIIHNPELGYDISYQLEECKIDFKEHSTFYAGYALFQEGSRTRKKFIRNRTKVYFGSMMHFMRSVYNNSLAQDGFLIRRMWRIPNKEKIRIRQMVKSSIDSQRANGASIVRGDLALKGDSSAYYSKILRQPDYQDMLSSYTLTEDSIRTYVNKSGNLKALYWKNYLAITYMKSEEDTAYIKYIGENRKPIPPFSLLQLQSDEPLYIDPNGNWTPPTNIISSGYWSWSDKVGTMLPLNYKPEEE